MPRHKTPGAAAAARDAGIAKMRKLGKKTRGEKDLDCIKKNRVVVHSYISKTGKKVKRQCRARPRGRRGVNDA